MSGWERTHRRYRLVYAVADDIANGGPEAIEKWQAAIDLEYGGLDEFLLDVQRRWYNAVDAHLDMVLESSAGADGTVPGVMQRVRESDGGLLAVLEAFEGHAALSAGARRHQAIMLALTGMDERAADTPRQRKPKKWHALFKSERRGTRTA